MLLFVVLFSFLKGYDTPQLAAASVGVGGVAVEAFC